MTDDNHGMYGLDLGKIDRLDTLLDAWKKTFDSGVYFNRDGIISNEHWMNANVKILFVLKETNQAEQNLTTAISIALRSEKSGWWKGKVLRRVGRGPTASQTTLERFPASKTRKPAVKKLSGVSPI